MIVTEGVNQPSIHFSLLRFTINYQLSDSLWKTKLTSGIHPWRRFHWLVAFVIFQLHRVEATSKITTLAAIIISSLYHFSPAVSLHPAVHLRGAPRNLHTPRSFIKRKMKRIALCAMLRHVIYHIWTR